MKSTTEGVISLFISSKEISSRSYKTGNGRDSYGHSEKSALTGEKREEESEEGTVERMQIKTGRGTELWSGQGF